MVKYKIIEFRNNSKDKLVIKAYSLHTSLRISPPLYLKLVNKIVLIDEERTRKDK